MSENKSESEKRDAIAWTKERYKQDREQNGRHITDRDAEKIVREAVIRGEQEQERKRRP
jgi:hypothetical protein